jgi:hypothetical protein
VRNWAAAYIRWQMAAVVLGVSRMNWRRRSWLGWIVVAALGCGRKATVEDCQQIVKRIVELELESVVTKQEMGSEVVQAQQTFKDRTLSDCVGRRITNQSLACVAAAKSTATIIDDCFN